MTHSGSLILLKILGNFPKIKNNSKENTFQAVEGNSLLDLTLMNETRTDN